MNPGFVWILAVVGLLVGSFVSALTWRLPRGIPFVKGSSFCPFCRKRIRWQDNIPLLSFVFLRGKCRDCGKKISWRYPAIELVSCLGFLGISFFNGGFLAYFLFVLTLIILVIDWENQIIPDQLVFLGLIPLFFYLLLGDFQGLFVNLASGFGAGFFLLLLHLITRGKGMGLGDVKFAVLGGLVLGWPATPVWFLSAFILGAIVGLTLIFLKKASFGQKIPFGPYLVISFWFTILII